MEFEFSPEQLAFVKEVETFLDANDDPDVFDVTRENMAQIVDTPKRRAFMASMGERGYLGMTWPKEYGGTEGEGVYEYLLNEQLARRGGPQIGKGVGIVGKTIIRHGNERMKAEFLPKILRNEVEFAVGYSEPNAGSDAASMQLKATRDDGGWILNGQKTWTTSAHFAEWYWVGGRTDPDSKHAGITLFLVPIDQPGITVNAIWTMGDERTNEVFLNDVFVPDDYVVGEVGRGFQYISEALDLERFTMFTLSPMQQRFEVLVEYVRTTVRDGVPLEGRPGDPPAPGPAGHAARGGPGHGAEVRLRVLQGWGGADGRGLRVQALRHRALQATGQRLHGHRRSRIAAAGEDGGGADGRALGVHLPLHRDRHHRRRGVGDPEEHHRPAQARTAEELLSVEPVSAAGGPLEGVTVLDFSTVGPAARCTRLLADYGALVVKVGPVPTADAAPIVPQYFAYSGHRGMRRVLVDLKDPEGREAFLSLAAAADVVVESFRPGVVDRLGVGYSGGVGAQPGGGLLLDERLRPGRPGVAVGRARHRLPRRGRLPGHEHAGRRGRATVAGCHGGRRGGGWHAGGAGHHGGAGGTGDDGTRRVSRRVGRARACCG